MIIVKLVAGLLILVIGAEFLVKGASRIAAAFGISSLVIGLTVVAFGTSAPELGVSLMASLSGNPDVAIGNVVGSNIFNILFVLGLSAMITPLVVAQQLIRLDVPVMIGASLLLLLFAVDQRIQVWEAGCLLVLGLIYTIYVIRASRKEQNQTVLKEYQQEFGEVAQKKKLGLGLATGLVLIGLAALVLGARWLVDGAVFLAQQFGVSDLVIGLTVIAAGTSLPELATSVVASIRGERDIAVGNAVGSNIFNILFILGITGCVSEGGIAVAQSAIYFDIPLMIAVAIACLPIFFTGSRLDRWEGAVFVFYYIAYTLYLILSLNQNPSLELFSVVMKWFVVPITVLTLIVVTVRSVRRTTKRNV